MRLNVTIAFVLQEALLPPDHDLITVSDVLLIMDQAGSDGNLTAAMLEVPATPDSWAEPWGVAAKEMNELNDGE